MSNIYNSLKNVIQEDKLALVQKFNDYLIKHYGINNGIDSSDASINAFRIKILSHNIVKNLSDDAFVKVLDIITIGDDIMNAKILETLLNTEQLAGKWEDTLVDYLSTFLLKDDLIEERKQNYFKHSNDIKLYIEEEPVFHVLISERFDKLPLKEFNQELTNILNSKYYYATSVARILSSNLLSKKKRKDALDVINDKYNKKTEEEKEFERLIKKENLNEEEQNSLERLSKSYAEIYEYGNDDLIDIKEDISKIAILPTMASENIDIREYTSMLVLLNNGFYTYETDNEILFRKYIFTCLSNEMYANKENKNMLFRSINYLLEHFEETNQTSAMAFAASDKAIYYNDEEFKTATELLANSFYEHDLNEASYELLTNENVAYEENKENYFTMISSKNISEIKKLTAICNYKAYAKKEKKDATISDGELENSASESSKKRKA